MFNTKYESVIKTVTVEDVTADRKNAKRVGQYKVSAKAIYKADGTYLPVEAITGYVNDKTSVHVSGCCAGGVPVERIIFDTVEDRQQFIFDTMKDVDKVLEIIGRN